MPVNGHARLSLGVAVVTAEVTASMVPIRYTLLNARSEPIYLPACGGVRVAAPRAVSIGGAEDAWTVLEEARRVLVIGDRVLSLHDNAPFLKVFDLSGRLVQSFGRAGAGPGEFRHPATAVYDPATGEILVFDDALGRVSHLAFGDTLSYRRARTLSVAARDACFIGRSLFIEALDGTHFIHAHRELRAAHVRDHRRSGASALDA